MSNFPEEIFKSSEATKMSLADMLKLKSLANNIAFMRLFFLKPQSPSGNLGTSSLEIIDCVLAIFLFELTRVVRTGRTLYRRDQIQFQILHFFSNLKACRVKHRQDESRDDPYGIVNHEVPIDEEASSSSS